MPVCSGGVRPNELRTDASGQAVCSGQGSSRGAYESSAPVVGHWARRCLCADPARRLSGLPVCPTWVSGLGLKDPIWLLLAALILCESIDLSMAVATGHAPGCTVFKTDPRALPGPEPARFRCWCFRPRSGCILNWPCPMTWPFCILLILLVALPYGLYRGSRPTVQSC